MKPTEQQIRDLQLQKRNEIDIQRRAASVSVLKEYVNKQIEQFCASSHLSSKLDFTVTMKKNILGNPIFEATCDIIACRGSKIQTDGVVSGDGYGLIVTSEEKQVPKLLFPENPESVEIIADKEKLSKITARKIRKDCMDIPFEKIEGDGDRESLLQEVVFKRTV